MAAMSELSAMQHSKKFIKRRHLEEKRRIIRPLGRDQKQRGEPASRSMVCERDMCCRNSSCKPPGRGTEPVAKSDQLDTGTQRKKKSNEKSLDRSDNKSKNLSNKAKD